MSEKLYFNRPPKHSNKKSIFFVLLGLICLIQSWISLSLIFGLMGWLFWKSKKVQHDEHLISNELLALQGDDPVHVPRNPELIKMLQQVDRRFQLARNSSIHLKQGLSSALETMWKHLRVATSFSEWKKTLEDVLAHWPVAPLSEMGDLVYQLNQTKSHHQNWEAAQREARRRNRYRPQYE